MNNIIHFLFLGLLMISCSQKVNDTLVDTYQEQLPILIVPDISIAKEKLIYQNQNSTWMLDGSPYSGYVEHYDESGFLMQRFGVFNGFKHGEALDWYEDGHLKFSANYYQGRLHGAKKVWYSNSTHQIGSELNYYLGKANGLQKKWYPTGEIFKLNNLNMGQEDGLQQAFRKNGVLYANYEAKEGREFGLKRAKLCFELDNETVVYGK